MEAIKEMIVLDHMTIRSPIDGFVPRANKHAGEETDEYPLMVVVAEISKLHAVFYPPKQLFGKVKVGDCDRQRIFAREFYVEQ